MTISEFFKLRTGYEARARARREERQNVGDDTSWQIQILEEMVIDLIARVDKLQAIHDELYGVTSAKTPASR